MGSHPSWWGVFQSTGDKRPLGMALMYSLSYCGTSQGVFQVCSCDSTMSVLVKAAGMMPHLQKARGGRRINLSCTTMSALMFMRVFPLTTSKYITPTYLRIVELHFRVVLCDDWKKKKKELCHHKDALKPVGNSHSFLAHTVVLHSSEQPLLCCCFYPQSLWVGKNICSAHHPGCLSLVFW